MSREAIKHTPGPWNYDRSGYSLYVNSGRELVTALSMDGKRLETSEANARLIAAAPDLLDVAKEANAELERLNDPRGFVSMRQERIMEKARAAIAKATGGEA
jgi:endonuclease III